MARVGSDTASKLFQLNKRIGCTIAGIAFLPAEGGIKNISAFIDEFKRVHEVELMDVEEMSQKLYNFFNTKYDWKTAVQDLKMLIKKDLENNHLQIVGDFLEENGILKFTFKDRAGKEEVGGAGVDRIDIMVGGFNHDGSHQSFICNIPGQVGKKRDSKEKGREYGAAWIGQTDVTSRIVLGWDVRMFALPFVQDMIKNLGEDKIGQQLRGLEYQISWGTMTLQDAVDFCTLAIKTTEAIQRFSDGIRIDPGDIPGVGGSIDVAVITRDKGFVWIKKKNIVLEGKEVDLDILPGLK